MPTNEQNSLPDGEELPDEVGINPADEINSAPKRRRMRVKVRKKIRIKQKPNSKNRFRKVAERAFWVLIIVGFVTSLIIMIVELDVRDEKYKQQKRRASPSIGQ